MIYQFGSKTLAVFTEIGSMTLFLGRALFEMITPPFRFRIILKQMYRIGVQSLPIVSLAALATGMVLAMQMASGFRRFGVVSYIAGIVGVAIVRELGPVLTAVMVAGRMGAGISAELGSMKITEQIDAMEVSALNPMKYLVATRILACILVLPLLTVCADFIGILGGYLIGVSQLKIIPSLYFNRTLEFVGFDDFVPGLIKSVFFGLIIGFIGTYKGFKTEGGGEGVGISTTAAVVLSCILILITDVILTQVLIILFGG